MPWTIQTTEAPVSLKTANRREPNLLWYGPSTILKAQEESAPTTTHPFLNQVQDRLSGRRGVLGVLRIALRDHEELRHGLMIDLSVPDGREGQEIASDLIRAGEEFFKKEHVTKIDAVVLDGKRASEPFLANGFWASRKTVVVEWHLPPLTPSRIKSGTGSSKGGAGQGIPEVSFEISEQPNPEEVAAFILSSYQPYWQWWKDDLHDRLWSRVDFPSKEPDRASKDNAQQNREKIITMLQSFNTDVPQRMVIARKDGNIIGLCDAKAVSDSDTFDWGVLLTRDHPGKGFGRALLLPALQWLHEQGMQKARMTTTSGLDDYDPTVYLYTQNGGRILGEFHNLVKRTV